MSAVLQPRTRAGAAAVPDELLIGLTGAPGAGKDTVANLLFPLGFRCIAFADKLRAEVAQAWRVDPGLLIDRTTKEWPLSGMAIGQCDDAGFIARMVSLGHAPNEPRSPRWICQRWGTEYRRAQDDEYWIRPVLQWVRRQRGIGCKRLIVTDVRFRNEAAALRRCDGRILTVHRPAADVELAQDTAEHVSQRERLTGDALVNNDGGLEALRLEVERVLRGLS